MTTTTQTLDRAIRLLRGAGINGLRDADPNVWALVLNAAPRTVTDQGGRRTPMLDEHGTPVPLNPSDEEIMPAATHLATLGGQFVQAADLAAAVQARREGDRALRRARVADDVAQHGAWIPAGLADDVPAELAARRAFVAAIGGGATRVQAQAHAWRSIGRTPPELEAGRDRSADVRALIASLPQRAA